MHELASVRIGRERNRSETFLVHLDVVAESPMELLGMSRAADDARTYLRFRLLRLHVDEVVNEFCLRMLDHDQIRICSLCGLVIDLDLNVDRSFCRLLVA